MNFWRISFLLVFLPSLLSCMVNAPPIKEHAAIEVPDGSSTKSITLAKVKSRITKGTHVGKIGEGMGCLGIDRALWQSGRTNIADESMVSAFISELKNYNYNVVGDPDDLFNNKAGSAELVVGGLITDVKWDVCFHNGYLDGWSKGSTYVEIEIEWQVYNALDRKTILKTKSTGQAVAEFDNKQFHLGFERAFGHAVRGLLADKSFYAAVQEPAPAGTMGVLSDNATGRQAERVAQTKSATVTGKNKIATVPDARERVVIVQVGGGHGSGFLIGNQGHILTNHHVVDGAKKARIVYADGSKTEGRVLKADAQQDVALIQVDAPPLGGLTPRMDDVPVGTDVYAIGSPRDMKFQGTVSKGVVGSYRNDKRGRWLQSDAAVNRGNSGGPLVDAQGRVVGICSWGFVGEDSAGMNFFVPIADALRVMNLPNQ